MSRSIDSRAELIFRPVRMRILQALLHEDRLTTGRIAEMLPDVPQATLYRHLSRLLDAGVVHVVEERPVRGVTERILSLAVPRASLGPPDLGSDGVGYRRFPLHLSDSELEVFTAAMNVVVERAMACEPGPHHRRILTRILIPAPAVPEEA